MKLIQAISIFNFLLLTTVFGQETVVGLGNGSGVLLPSSQNVIVVPPVTTISPIGSGSTVPTLKLQTNVSSPLLPGTSVGSSAALTLPGLGEFNLPTLPPLFGPTPCFGINLMAGTCRREAECVKSGGQSAGPCALNLGVCCTKTSQCGDTVRLNESIFTNPNYPEPSPLTDLCSMTIAKLPGVGQIRLDIVDLQIGEVDEGGKCSQDALVIDGLNPGVTAPRLCGFMTNQHLYLPVDETAIGGLVTLRLILSPVSKPRLFKIKVSQIPLGSPQSAPPGCLQYFTSPSGTINSFNFESSKNVGLRSIGGLNYAICFRQEAGMCSVRFDPLFLGAAHSVAKRSVDPLAPPQLVDPLGAKSFPRSAKYVSNSAYPPKAYQGFQIKPSSPKTYNYREPAPTQKQYVHRPAPQRPVYRQRLPYKPSKKSYQEYQPTYVQPKKHHEYQTPVQRPFDQYRGPVYRQPAPQSYPIYQAPRQSYPAPAPQSKYHPQVYKPAAAYYPAPVYAPVEVKKEEKVEIVEEKKIPDLVQAKVDLVQSLINEKTQILNSLLNNTGTGLPSILPTPALVPSAGAGIAVGGALPIIPIPQVPTLTDSALKPFLPSLPTAGLGSLGGALLPGAPIDLSALASCQGKNSIGFPPSAILCDDNVHPVILSTAPFMIFVDNRGAIPSKGFSFSYRQQICS